MSRPPSRTRQTKRSRSVPRTIPSAIPTNRNAKNQIPSPYLQVGSNQLVLYDVRKSVKEEIKEITMSGLSAMLNVGMTEIRIISKAFPWSIDIKAPAGYHVTCNSVFRALHDQLQNYITDVEWAIVAVDKTRKKAICEAANLRQKKDKDNKLKRIDWLGDMTVFKGLEEDKEFENEICLRGQMTVTGTWVARFGKKDM